MKHGKRIGINEISRQNKRSNNSPKSQVQTYHNAISLNYLKCKTDAQSKNAKVSKTSNAKTMLLSKCAV